VMRASAPRPLSAHLRHATFLRVVVPSKTANRRLLDLDHWTRIVLGLFLPIAGGATEISARGHWLDEQRRHVIEPVRLLEIYLLERVVGAQAKRIQHELTWIAIRMRQEALAIAVGHRLHLI